MSKKVTIRDVAEKAGVAPSTVSFVLNDVKNQTISESTRQLVIDCANELGYVANFWAGNMRKRISRTIGVVLSYKLAHTYSHDIIHGLSEETIKQDYGILICGVDRYADEKSYFVKCFLEGRIDGIVFISSAHSEESSCENEYIDLFNKYRIPFVVLYGYTRRSNVSYINIDLKQGSYMATKYLIEQGSPNLVYIGVLNKDNSSPFLPKTERDRIEGYKEAVDNPVVDFVPRDFARLDENSAAKLLQYLNGVDGFVVCWATIGIQLSKHIKTLGLGRGYSIITLDHLPYMEYTSRDIMTMKLPFYEMSQLGIRTLMDKLENKNQKDVVIHCPCHF